MLILIKGQKPKAVETIIEQIISNPMIFVFGEFLSQPNVIEVSYISRINILFEAWTLK